LLLSLLLFLFEAILQEDQYLIHSNTGSLRPIHT
jgi:hypothetical protein